MKFIKQLINIYFNVIILLIIEYFGIEHLGLVMKGVIELNDFDILVPSISLFLLYNIINKIIKMLVE